MLVVKVIGPGTCRVPGTALLKKGFSTKFSLLSLVLETELVVAAVELSRESDPGGAPPMLVGMVV